MRSYIISKSHFCSKMSGFCSGLSTVKGKCPRAFHWSHQLRLLILAERIRKLGILHRSLLPLCQESKVTWRWKARQIEMQIALHLQRGAYAFILICYFLIRPVGIMEKFMYGFFVLPCFSLVVACLRVLFCLLFFFFKFHLTYNLIWLEMKGLEELNFEKYWCTLFLPLWSIS